MKNQRENSRANNSKNPCKRKKRKKTNQKETYAARDEADDQRNQKKGDLQTRSRRATKTQDKQRHDKRKEERIPDWFCKITEEEEGQSKEKTRQGPRRKSGRNTKPDEESETSNQKWNGGTKSPENSTTKKTPCRTHPTHHFAP